MDSEEQVSPGDYVIELGDYITIDNTRYGAVKGTVYYRDENLIRVMPEGVSDRVYDFRLEDGDFADEYGVREVILHRKHLLDSFVRLQDLRVGQTLETFTADGEHGPTFRIIAVDEEADAIEVEDTEGGRMTITYDYTGIPLDIGFTVMRSRETVAELPVAEETAEGEDTVAAADVMTQIPEVAEALEEDEVPDDMGEEGAAEPAEDTEFDLEVVGVITIPVAIEIQDIPSSEQTYPDAVQKADALNDIIMRLTQAEQNDAKKLRSARLLVEIMYRLKQELVKYSPAGIPIGTAITSADTIAQLFNATHVPIGRPVLDVVKSVYVLEEEEEGAGVSTRKGRGSAAAEAEKKYADIPLGGIPSEGQLRYYSQGAEGNAQVEDSFTAATKSSSAGALAKAGEDKKDNFWLNLLSYMRKYGQPWQADENMKGVQPWYAVKDTEFFRGGIPDLEDPTIEGHAGEIGMSLERALGPIYHPDAKKKSRLTFPAEGGPILNYVMFPLKEAASFGSTRTGLLGVDIDNSLRNPRTTRQAIEAAGGIQEVATGTSFIALGATGNTIGNISLVDYLEALEIGGRGFADMTALLTQLGLMEIELSSDVGAMLGKKLDGTRRSIEEYVRALRRRLEEVAETLIAGPTVSDADAEEGQALTAAMADPILLEKLKGIRAASPIISKATIVQVATLLKEHPDLFVAIAGGQPAIVAKQTLAARRRLFLSTLAAATALRDLEAMKGAPPQPNKCEHVALLRDIRRIEDTPTQFIRMAEFIRKFQGKRDENWIECRECKQNLLCIHELIQMQQYLNPKDSSALQKELLLGFSGPIQGGQYQCRNCGQGIAALDYDRGMEFTDEGQPLTGGQLIDADAIRQDEIRQLLGGPLGAVEDEDISAPLDAPELDADKDEYDVIKEIVTRIGVFPDKAGYVRMIKTIKTYMAMLKTREDYVASMKPDIDRGVKVLDYDIYKKRKFVSCAAAVVLIEVQTRVPDYIIRYTLPGCMKPGFLGMPLGAETDKTGIDYLSCAVAAIMKNQPPWNMTGFFRERNPVKRQAGIAKYVEAAVRELASDARVQYYIAEKKKYLKAVYGSEAGDQLQDVVPASFLPRLAVVRREEAADAPIIPEVVAAAAEGQPAGHALADLWIQVGNSLAKKTAFLVRGSPFADTTCCVSSVTTPGVFWSAVGSLPPLSKRRVRSAIGGTRFMVPFGQREKREDLPVADPSMYHRVFLNVCFRGPRIGRPHEPGLTLRCPWCDFVFPSHPRVLDYDGEGKSALEEQGVEVTETAFLDVLDATHRVQEIQASLQTQVARSDAGELIARLATVQPPLSLTWKDDLIEMMQGISRLGKQEKLEEADVAMAAGRLSDTIARAQAGVYGRLDTMKDIFAMMNGLQGGEIREVVKTYFLVPFQRILSGLDADAHAYVPAELGLSEKHVDDIIRTVLIPNEKVNRKFCPIYKSPKASFAKAKLRHYVKQIAAALSAAEGLSEYTTLGGEVVFHYIMEYLLYVPLAAMINPNEIPPEEYDTSMAAAAGDGSMKLLITTVAATLERYKDERIVFSDRDLQEKLQIRNEKEAMAFVNKFDVLSDEMKAIEKAKKKYRIGDWAVGGSAAIYSYNPDRYDAEREERLMAGIMEEPVSGDTYDLSEFDIFAAAPRGGVVDEGDYLDMDAAYEDNF
jgi:hypothetical protein